jgi:cation transport ATPase
MRDDLKKEESDEELIENAPEEGASDDEVNSLLDNSQISDYTDTEAINNYVLVVEARNKSHKITELTEAWKEYQKSERMLRKNIAYIVFSILSVEIIAGNVFFLFYGLKKITFPQWLATSFFVAMFVQVVSIVIVIINGLFPKPKEDFLSKLTDIIKDI